MSEQQPSDPKGIVLTVDDVRQWKADLLSISVRIDSLNSEREAIEQRLKGASYFLDIDQIKPAEMPIASQAETQDVVERPEVQPRQRRRASRLTWTDVILDGVKSADLGMTYAEMKQFAAKSELGRKLETSDKGYHNAIGRLARAGDIVREHGRLFTDAAYERFMKEVAEGKASTTVQQPMAHSPMGEAILDIVGAKPAQLNGKGVIRELRRNPEFNATLTPHETGAYNIIARLVRRKQIIRRDDGFLMPGGNFPRDRGGNPPQRDGALNGYTASAPSAGEAATSPIERQDSERRLV